MRHPVRGLLVAPLVAPVTYWIGVIGNAWAHDFGLGWIQALRELMTIAAFGLPIAYAVALVWGAPVLYALYRFGWLRAGTVVVAGAVGGAIVTVWLAHMQQGSFFRVEMPLAGGAVIGALAGVTCWWAGRGKSKQGVAGCRNVSG